MEILKEELIIDAEAKEILDKREKQAELKYEQKNAAEILRKFIKTDSEKIKKLMEELRTIEGLREKQIIAIANFLPEDKDDLRVVLHKDYTSLAEGIPEKILETVKRNI